MNCAPFGRRRLPRSNDPPGNAHFFHAEIHPLQPRRKMKPTTRRSFIQTSMLAFPALVGLNAIVRAHAANEGKLGVALCGLGGFSEKSIAPELPGAARVYFAGAITGDAAKGRAWAQQYGFPEKNIFSYAAMAKLADRRVFVEARRLQTVAARRETRGRRRGPPACMPCSPAATSPARPRRTRAPSPPPCARCRLWAYQPVKKPAVPGRQASSLSGPTGFQPVAKSSLEGRLPGQAGSLSSIDAFLAVKVPAGLTPAPPCDARTFIRRATFDLLGLPPTPEEVATFEADSIRDPRSAIRKLIRAPARVAALRRAHGAALARCRALRGHERLCQRLRAWKCVALSRLRGALVQCRQALRSIRARADRRR